MFWDPSHQKGSKGENSTWGLLYVKFLADAVVRCTCVGPGGDYDRKDTNCPCPIPTQPAKCVLPQPLVQDHLLGEAL